MTSRSEGFTLVELLIVLAIMAVAGTMLATHFGVGRAGAELRAASRELVAALDETRSVAIAQNRIAALTLDAGTRRYRDARGFHAIPARLAVAWRGLVPAGGDGRTAAIYFFPDGSSSGGEIDFAAGDAKRAVSVDWFTGAANAHAIQPTR
ncbi:MAG TPA: GspH/FimT family pseudopilin [Stellaceae bacterium]|nr:GspH/FimT family pseudopilin [Stellaceae bacterium]